MGFHFTNRNACFRFNDMRFTGLNARFRFTYYYFTSHNARFMVDNAHCRFNDIYCIKTNLFLQCNYKCICFQIGLNSREMHFALSEMNIGMAEMLVHGSPSAI